MDGKKCEAFLNQTFLSPNYIMADIITQAILKHAQVAVAPYMDPSVGPPDPAFTLHLPDEVYTGSNLYAVQKLFDGEFQFDVFFESGSNKQKLSCELRFSPSLRECHYSRTQTISF